MHVELTGVEPTGVAALCRFRRRDRTIDPAGGRFGGR
jgi:hypothetical protein